MKKGFYAILAALAVFALVMTGCDTGGGDPPPPTTVTITFNLNGGKIGTSTADVVKTNIPTNAAFPSNQLPAEPTKDNETNGISYFFTGWSRGQTDATVITVKTTTFTADTTLYAQYITVQSGQIALLYDDNFIGAAVVAPVLIDAGDAVTLRTPASRGAGTFAGWFTNANGTGTAVTATTSLSANTRLYAKWTIVITFAVDKGAYTGNPTVPDAVTLTLPYDNGGVALGTKLKSIKLPATELDFMFDAYYLNGVEVTTTTKFTANTTITGKIIADERLKITFEYSADDNIPDVLIRLPEGQSFDIAGKKLPAGKDRAEYVFGYWKDPDGNKITAESSFLVDTTLTQVWWKNTLTSDGGEWEKLSLDNAGLAIYKFALGANKIADYKEFRVTYKVTEAALNISQTRNRVYGNFGTFASQKNTTNADKFDATDINGFQDANGTTLLNAPKFNVGGYIFPTGGGRDKPWTSADITGNIIDSAGNVVDDASVTADTWFTLRYPIVTASLVDTTDSPFYKDATGDLYFALGLTTNGDSRDTEGRPNPNSNNFPIVQLVKSVTLVHNTDSAKNITATIPNPVSEASFMAYASPVETVWCWRGPNSGDIPEPDPLPPGPDFPEPVDNFTVPGGDLDLTLYYNDGAKDPTTDTRKRVIISGDTITFDLRANDYNQSPGLFGGGGFKILFDDLGLPEYDDDVGNPIADYRSYSKITLTFDITPTVAGDDLTSKQIIFSAINGGDGGDVQVVNGPVGTPGRYVGLQSGTDVTYWFSTSDLVVGKVSDSDPTPLPGVAVRANNWASNNVPIQCTIKVKRITFNK